jgi:alpha-galactosidase
MLIGCPIEQIDDFTLSLLSNDEVLEINQDPLGLMAGTVSEQDGKTVLAKEMEDGSLAVGLFNKTDTETIVRISWKDLGISGKHIIRDLWRQKDVGTFEEAFETTVQPHGVVLVRVSKLEG